MRLRRRVDGYDWSKIETDLTEDGVAVLSRLLSPADCQFFCEMFDDRQRFAKQVVMDKPQFGKGIYKYFRSPVPAETSAMRQLLYCQLVAIVNRWMGWLSKPELPEVYSDFLQLCANAGQISPTPLL